MKIIQVGLYPPPYGGVSIHLCRLMEHLELDGKDALLIDLSPNKKNARNVKTLSWWRSLLFLFVSKRSIIHAHNYSVRNLIIYWMLHFQHRVIISFHNERYVETLYAHRASWTGRLIVAMLRKMDGIVVDNRRSLELLKQCLGGSRLHLIPEFIPPMSVPEVEDSRIMEMRTRHKYLLGSNAFMIAFHNGKDLYGMDMLIDAVAHLWHDDGIDVGMVFLLPSIGDITYYAGLLDRVRQQNIADRFCFIHEPLPEASSLWKLSDVVIRATNTDGNSLTVWEALAQGTPVIASDCVERPEACILFCTRDLDDLCRTLKHVLNNIEDYRLRLKGKHVPDNVSAFIHLYNTLEESQRSA